MEGGTGKLISPRPVVGVSSCLLGNEVRYDGRHKLNRFVCEELAREFDLEAFCPEVAIGMGIPRPPIRLAARNGIIEALGVENIDLDVTTPLREYGREIARRIGHLSGFVLKKGSPSCGVNGVPVCNADGTEHVDGIGLFAAEIIAAVPGLPVAEENQFDDPVVREAFMARVHAFHGQR